MQKCDHTSARVVSSKCAAYLHDSFSEEHLWGTASKNFIAKHFLTVITNRSF